MTLWLLPYVKQINTYEGLISIEGFWEKWSKSNQITLNYDFAIGGRNKESNEIIDNLKQGQILQIESLSSEESIAFTVASILNSEITNKEQYIDRCIVIQNDNIQERIIRDFKGLIIITSSCKCLNEAYHQGHTILYAACPISESPQLKKIKLPKARRENLINSLETSGINSDEARYYEKNSFRDIIKIREFLNFTIDIPEWRRDKDSIRCLIPAILAGSWNENYQGDIELLEELSNNQYKSYISRLHLWAKSDNAPINYIENIWKITSPYLSIRYILEFISYADKQSISNLLLKIFDDEDPNGINKLKNSWGFYKEERKYSYCIKKGILNTLTLLSVFNHCNTNCEWVNNIIKTALNNFTLNRFISNKDYLTNIAEAAPNEFLSFIESDLNSPNGYIRNLFIIKENNNSWEITQHFHELLWGIEMLMWDEDYFFRCCNILADLSQLENNSNVYNRPYNSLYNSLRLILPQTLANETERDKVLFSIANKYKTFGFKLCLDVLKSLDQTSFHPNECPKWRNYDKIQKRDNTIPYIDSSRIQNILDFIFKISNYTEGEICELLTVSTNYKLREHRKSLIHNISKHINQFSGNDTILKTIRQIISHHSEYSGKSYWAMNIIDINLYTELMHQIEPDDLKEKNKWLFQNGYIELIKDSSYNDKQKQLREYQKKAVQEIFAKEDFKGILTFSNIIENADILGVIVAEIYGALYSNNIYRLSVINKIKTEFSLGYYRSLYFLNGPEWYTEHLKELGRINIDYLYLPLRAGYCNKDILEIVKVQPNSIQQNYWKHVETFSYDKSQVLYIIDNLCHVQRYTPAFYLIFYNIDLVKDNIEYFTNIISNWIITNNVTQQLKTISYPLSHIISEIDKHTPKDKCHNLLRIEILIFSILKQHIDVSRLVISKMILEDPMFMLEILKATYLNDNGDIEAEIDTEISYHNYKLLDTILSHSSINDETKLIKYCEELVAIGEKFHYSKAAFSIIGQILGMYQEDDNYPPTAICEFIEKHNNEHLESQYARTLFNKRSGIAHYTDDGITEKKHSEVFAKYYNKTKYMYNRISMIFKNLEKNYLWLSEKDSKDAKIRELLDY